MFKIRKTAALAALFCSSVLNAWASADHMVIAMPQIPTIIEPQGINNNAIDRYVGNVFETLLKADQKTGELKPGLAESWCRLSPDTVAPAKRRRAAPSPGNSSATSRKWSKSTTSPFASP